MSKQKSEQEVRNDFLEKVNLLIEYWKNQSGSDEDKLEGLAFSIFVALDGESADLPGFIVAPYPHKDDKKYRIGMGQDYYPDNNNSKVKCDIAGSLHEDFMNTRRKLKDE